MTLRAFDPLEVALTGTHLVEASAGTGKTHGLTALFVRLVAEAGLDPRQVAVVTFTEAATRELRARVRGRLVALARRFVDAAVVPDVDAGDDDGKDDGTDNDGAQDIGDEQLDALAERLRGDSAAERRVRAAIAALDDATISTIHGFARRVLQDFALEAGAPFATMEPGDGTLVMRRAVADFWRREVHSSPPAVAAWMLDQCVSPDTLAKWLEEPLRVGWARVEPVVEESGLADIERALEAARTSGAGFASLLLDEARAVLASGTLYAFSNSHAKHYAALERHARAIAGWLTDESLRLSPPLRAMSCFSQSALRAASKKGGPYATTVPALYAWAEATLPIAVEQARLRRAAFIRRAAREVRERSDAIQAERRTTSFDAIILDLARLVRDPSVAAAVRARYRVAIVDEFQDTDADQYDIFRALFHGRVDGGLFLIGDPKQAIYRFRGGDVFAYRRAGRDAGPNRYDLARNFRSDPGLIAAVNALFDPQRTPDPFVHDFIGYVPSTHGVAAQASKRVLDVAAQPVVAWLGAPGTRRDEMNETLFRAIAAEIVTLLDAHPDKPPTIAVLLRDRHEIAACVAELSRWNVPVSANTTARVWNSEQASELRIVLDALAAPRDLRRARAALATDMLGYDEAAILALGDDGAFEPALALLDRLRSAAIDQGPAALARALAQHAGPRWLARVDGRRGVTNLLHLGSLLQSRWATMEGLGAVIACIERERASKDEQGELRPDHGGAPVEVLTIHKSKGLQWDVVFAPTLYAGKDEKIEKDPIEITKRAPVSYHADDGSLRVDAGSAEWFAHARQRAEELRAEQVRLAYVALTRARHRVFTYWGPSKVSGCSPLLRLLHPGGGKVDDRSARDALLAWSAAAGDVIEVRDVPAQVERRRWNDGKPAAPIAARPFATAIDRTFRLSSFSSLFGGAHDDAPDRDERAIPVPSSADGPVPADPRGAGFGDFVHAVLETTPFSAFGTAEADRGIDELARDHGYGERAVDYVRQLAAATAEAPIAPGIRLRDLPRRSLKAELEFFFPLEGVRLDDVAAALARSDDYRRSAVELAHLAPRWSGLMHGYIDLVYAHDGRAGVIDYKTNFLGARYEDYDDASLKRAVRQHDYDLQYLIYTVACVRHLRLRHPHFDYERDFDGVAYLFLRGLPGGAGIHRDKPPRGVIDALDRAFAGLAREAA